MPEATRSFHPLPFTHLEPKRFEDLIRQLIYDFRDWRQLEATGRAGSDDGFDARGFEITSRNSDLESSPDSEEVIDSSQSSDRLWLVQCKREQTIGPSKLVAYLADLGPEAKSGLHGIIFAAACTFSKKTRDAFRSWCLENSLQEFYLWGAAEIEDLLYLPKNDHLLFAYFGISLQIRKLKAGTEIRRLVALKRKLNRHIPLSDHFGKAVVLRDASDKRYPFTDGKTLEEGKFLWLPSYSTGISAVGLRVVLRRHWAYYNYEHEHWDFASGINLSVPSRHENPFHQFQIDEKQENLTDELRAFWLSIPRGNQFHLVITGRIGYDEIVEVDDVGDNELKAPTIFVTFRDGRPPFEKQAEVKFIPSLHSVSVPINHNNHVRLFADKFRDVAWEEGWFSRNNIAYSKKEFVLAPPDEPTSIPHD